VNWIIFAILAYLAAALQDGLVPTLLIQAPVGEVRPNLLLILAVFLAMHAPSRVVLLTWAALGLILDILTVDYAGGAVLLGPYTFGFLAGAVVALQLRQVVLKHHVFSLAFCTAVCGTGVALIVVGIFGFRNLYDPLAGYSPLADLAARVLGVLYTAVLALPLSWPLIRWQSIFSFHTPKMGARR